MPKGDVHPDLDQPGIDGRCRILGTGAEGRRRPPDQDGITGGLCGGHGHEPLRRLRELGDPAAEALLDPIPHRQRRQSEATRQLRRRPTTRPLHERERVAACLGHDPIPHPIVDPGVQHPAQQAPGVVVPEPLHDQLREPEVDGGVTGREHQPDRFRQQPPGDEPEHLHRLPVEPLRVVDDAQQRAVVGHHRQQRQDRQPDQQRIRRAPRHQPEGARQRVPLRPRQVVDPIEHRQAQLVQRGWWVRIDEVGDSVVPDAAGAEHFLVQAQELERPTNGLPVAGLLG